MNDKVHNSVRKVVLFVFDPLVRFLTANKISPNTISWIGFAVNISAMFTLMHGLWLYSGLIILLGGLFDMLDGYIARNLNRVTKFGALLDSTLDRYSELFVYLGLSIFYLRQDEVYGLLGIFFTIAGSIIVSYVRARAEGLGFECRIGFIQRPERVVVMAFGCFLGYPWINYIIYFLAITTNYTVLQRIIHVYKISNTK